MKIITNYNDYCLINESLDPLKKYELTEDQWEAMRINPESGISSDLSQYFSKKSAKDFVGKIIGIVCDIFGDDDTMRDFMMNVAAVESCYGINPDTYKRPNQTKGIFQLDKGGALTVIGYKGYASRSNSFIKKKLREYKALIKKEINLNWDEVPYSSIAKPLYNAIGARMYIGVEMTSYVEEAPNKFKGVDHPIPKDKEGQAKWWKKRYNTTRGAGEISKFMNPPGCF